ncbi:MAG: M3 family oligoendopeptidase, partial [Planococcaceae bacterium]|nr:M3 family oligoendopeptidase [Planococcaceae bacterium]
MVTFDQYTYNRPNFEEAKERFEGLLTAFKEADSMEQQSEAIAKINEFRESFSTQANLAFIRASIDTKDEFYQKERDYFDEVSPQLEELVTAYYKELVSSKFRNELEEKWGSQLFDLADYSIKAFSPEIIELMQQENKLSSEYSKLVASAQVE